jgi:Tfp pilus assembly protein PilX
MRSRTAKKDDAGAALILVLVIIMVISLALVALLSMADTGVRATVGLRDQAGQAYAADAAAKVAIDKLRSDTFNGTAGGCDTASTQTLPNFYPATSTVSGASAAVRCNPDPSNESSGGGSNSSPGSAILTLGTGSEGGIYLDDSANQTVKVRGGIFSNSTIFLRGNKSDLENIATNSYVFAMGSCGSDGSSQLISTPAPVCNYSSQPVSANDRRGKDPGTVATHGTAFDAPPAPTAVGSVLPATCSAPDKVYRFQPGIYTDATVLNAFTNNPTCGKSVFHFTPGRYYFDFKNAGTHRWTVALGYLIGGTPTSTLKVTPPPTTPGACVAPGSASASTTSGVQFVFGGDSRMESTKNGTDNANIEICASNSASGPPIAVYGLKQTIGSGSMQVTAQSGCITAAGYPLGGDSSHCPLLQSYSDPSPSLTIQGTMYTPRSMLDLYLNNNTVQVFRWGLVTRGIKIRSTGSTGSLSNPVIDVPADAPLPFALPGLMYLNVYVCPGASSCGITGPVRLRVKVRVSPSAPRTVTVLGWNNQR